MKQAQQREEREEGLKKASLHAFGSQADAAVDGGHQNFELHTKTAQAGTPDGAFPQSLEFTYPSGEEPVGGVWTKAAQMCDKLKHVGLIL